MFVFSVFAVAIIVGIFSFELLIRGSSILKSLGVVLGNVSSVLSGSTLLTIFEEGINLMFFRRAREERAKLKEEREAVEAARASLEKETKQLEELKAELSQAASNVGTGTSKAGNVESDTKPPAQSTKPKN